MCIRDSHQHCKGWRLDAPDHQLLVIERGEKAGAVDADKPVRLRAAECRFIETVIFLAVPEMIEAFAAVSYTHLDVYKRQASRKPVTGMEGLPRTFFSRSFVPSKGAAFSASFPYSSK